MFDMRTRHPVEGYAHTTERAHKATVWMAKHVPQNRDLFMTTGGNGACVECGWRHPPSCLHRHRLGDRCCVPLQGFYK